jgi:hypothetical protein
LTINANGCIDTFCDSLTVDSVGIIGRFSQNGFTINVVSPEAITNNNPASALPSLLGTKQSQLRCYPNPAKDKLFVEGSKFYVLNSKLSITDVLGNEIEVQNSKSKVQSDATFNIELSILHLKAGIYFVKCGNETMKFIKE